MSRGRMRQRYPTTNESFSYRVEGEHPMVYIDDEAVDLEAPIRGRSEGWCRWKGRVVPFAHVWVNDELHLWLGGSLFIFQRLEEPQRDRRAVGPADVETPRPEARQSLSVGDGRRITSVLAGRVLSIRVSVGDSVAAGDELCVLEAMKMEHSVKFTTAGTVKAVYMEPGQTVAPGDLLAELEDLSSDN